MLITMYNFILIKSAVARVFLVANFIKFGQELKKV